MNNSIKKGVVVAVILLFVSVSIVSSTGTLVLKNSIGSTFTYGRILYVGGSGPGNYTKIQYAINDAGSVDTVFVFDDSSPYYENIVIDKSLKLVGENRNTTVIDGSGKGDVIRIIGDGATISSFTISNGSKNQFDKSGIEISSNHNIISFTKVIDNLCGIYCRSFSYNTIINNTIQNNGYGIFLDESDNNFISENNFVSNEYDHLRLSSSDANTITKNIFKYQSRYGIYLYQAKSINISSNSFYHCGISFDYSSFTDMVNNTVNGKPLIYMVGESNKTIKEAGQVILNDCNNITIQGLDLSNVSYGIIGYNINNCLIADSTFNHNIGGICLRTSSSNNIIKGNMISYCSDAIRLSGNRNNVIRDNNIYSGGWIDVYQCTNIFIINNTIIKGGWSVYLQSSTYCNISNNIISQGHFGIFFEFSSKHNIISYNDIRDNKRHGIKLHSSSNENIITNNNIIDNHPNAFFINSNKNSWVKNYWGKSRMLPKPIFGVMKSRVLPILWINFDWHPAQEPYDIGV